MVVTFSELGAQDERQVWEGGKPSPARDVQETAGGGGLEFRREARGGGQNLAEISFRSETIETTGMDQLRESIRGAKGSELKPEL